MILVAYVYTPKNNPHFSKYYNAVVSDLKIFVGVCKEQNMWGEVTVISITEITQEQADLLKGE